LAAAASRYSDGSSPEASLPSAKVVIQNAGSKTRSFGSGSVKRTKDTGSGGGTLKPHPQVPNNHSLKGWLVAIVAKNTTKHVRNELETNNNCEPE